MFELLSIPAIILAVEAFKRAGLPIRYCALLAIAVGLIIGYLLGDLVSGALYGLAASGAYSGAKSLFQLATAAERDKTWDMIK